MRKKLRLDDLVVESFEAGEPTLARGTVRAHESNGVNCTLGCSVEVESCPCGSLAYQLVCAEVTNDSCVVPCPGGSNPSLVC